MAGQAETSIQYLFAPGIMFDTKTLAQTGTARRLCQDFGPDKL